MLPSLLSSAYAVNPVVMPNVDGIRLTAIIAIIKMTKFFFAIFPLKMFLKSYSPFPLYNYSFSNAPLPK